jgi:hypothetical protein
MPSKLTMADHQGLLEGAEICTAVWRVPDHCFAPAHRTHMLIEPMAGLLISTRNATAQ